MGKIIKQIRIAISYIFLTLIIEAVIETIAFVFCGYQLAVKTRMQENEIDFQSFGEMWKTALHQMNGWIIIVYGIVTILVLMVHFKRRNRKFRQEVGMLPLAKWDVMVAVLIGILSCTFISSLLKLLPESMISDYNEQYALQMSGSQTWVMLLAAVIVAPVVEEVIFRGLVLSSLKEVLPIPVAVVMSNLFFGLLHVQVVWVIYATLCGILFSVIALHTGSILASICAHMFFNLIGFLMDRIDLPQSIAILACIFSGVFLMTILCFWTENKHIIKL